MIAPKFRASYTILSTWESGQWEKAIEYYFKLKEFVSPSMVEGRKWHEDWEKYISANASLPVEFGGKKLIKPAAELKKVVELEPWLDLVGKIDCFDEPTIYEFKTGKQSSEAYASSPQAGVYAVLATCSGLYADRAEIHHYDQYTKKHDMSIVWITDELLEKSHNWVVSLASEMHNYFMQNALYERFSRSVKGND